jgi:hypothetical protein
MFGGGQLREFGLLGAILSRITRGEDYATPGTEYSGEAGGVVFRGGVDNGVDRGIGRIEAFLR